MCIDGYNVSLSIDTCVSSSLSKDVTSLPGASGCGGTLGYSVSVLWYVGDDVSGAEIAIVSLLFACDCDCDCASDLWLSCDILSIAGKGDDERSCCAIDGLTLFGSSIETSQSSPASISESKSSANCMLCFLGLPVVTRCVCWSVSCWWTAGLCGDESTSSSSSSDELKDAWNDESTNASRSAVSTFFIFVSERVFESARSRAAMRCLGDVCALGSWLVARGLFLCCAAVLSLFGSSFASLSLLSSKVVSDWRSQTI